MKLLKSTTGLLVASFITIAYLPNAMADGDWPFFGGNKHSTNSYNGQSDIDQHSVQKRGFRIIWTLKTDPDFNGNNDDDVQPGIEPGFAKKPSYMPPAVIDGKLYFTAFGEEDIDPGPDVNLQWVSNVFAVDANTGVPLPGFPVAVSDYQTDASNYINRPVTIRGSRNTPTVYNNQLIFGSKVNVPTLAEFSAGIAQGVVLSIDATTAAFNWATLGDNHPSTRLSGSPMVHDGLLYVGVSIPDYALPLGTGGAYKCCSARSSLMAIDPTNGHVVWRTYLVPPAPGQEDLDGPVGSVNGIDKRRVDDPMTMDDESWYAGNSIWGGAPTIDEERGLVIIGTGNGSSVAREARLCEKQRRYEQDQLRDVPLKFPNLTPAEHAELGARLEAIRSDIGAGEVVCDAPPVVLTDMASAAGKTVALNDAFLETINAKGHKSYGNYPDSVVAMDLKTGKVRWAYRFVEYDAYTVGCDVWFTPISTLVCPEPYGLDADVGQAPMLVTIWDNHKKKEVDIVLAANKAGKAIALEADTGKVYHSWNGPLDLGQLSIIGGSQFGSSSDGQRYFVNVSHQGNNKASFFGFINLNDPLGGTKSIHKVCYANVLDDERTALGDPTVREEVNSDTPLPGCTIVQNYDNTPGIRETTGDYLSGIDIKTGKVKWQYADPSGDPSLPDGNISFKQGGTSVVNDVVFSGSTTGIMRFHNAKTGKILLEIDLNTVHDGEFANMIDSAPAIVGNRVYWGTGIAGIGAYNEFNPFLGSDNVRMIALELCPEGTTSDPDDITQCKEDDDSSD